MLSKTWEELQDDQNRRTNLFRGLSRILLSLARVPLPKIGSFTMNDLGVISLTNRPLTLGLLQLENEGYLSRIPRSRTYSTVEPYLSDLFALHDTRLRDQPNSINDEADCRGQMAALTMMQAVSHHFVEHRNGPFLFTLTDTHQSNIIVDKEWNVKRLIDLEWACALPLDCQGVPYWLTGQSIDGIIGDELLAFDHVREEFMTIFEDEENMSDPYKTALYSQLLRKNSNTKQCWFFHALNCPMGLPAIFWQHIQPLFAPYHALDTACNDFFQPYWTKQVRDTINQKLAQREEYDNQLKLQFVPTAKLQS